jgi:transcriptional regulator with XRE-family HTH domain
MEKFCDFIRKLRLEREITLKQFCLDTNIAPSSWSKIERGLISAPQRIEVLERVKNVLKLNMVEYERVVELAIESQDLVNLNQQENSTDKLPIFVKSSRGKLSLEDLKKLLELIVNEQKG